MDDYIVSGRNLFDFDLQPVRLLRNTFVPPRLVDPDCTLPVVFQFYPKVHRYAFDNHNHSSVTVASLTDLDRYPVRTEIMKPTVYCGCYDLRELSSSTEILSKSMAVANPNITPGTVVHDVIVNEIVSLVNKYSNPKSIKRYSFLTVKIYIDEHALDRCECEECRAIRESALMAAEKLIVPASESSIKKLLKRVRVAAAAMEEDHEDSQRKRRRRSKSGNKASSPSDSDDCTICCDEFTAGKYASQMPCLHSFHNQCIQRWLRRSHYCPVCRYEMPVADDDREDG